MRPRRSIFPFPKRAKKKLQINAWKEKGKVDGKWFWELPVMPAIMKHDDL